LPADGSTVGICAGQNEGKCADYWIIEKWLPMTPTRRLFASFVSIASEIVFLCRVATWFRALIVLVALMEMSLGLISVHCAEVTFRKYFEHISIRVSVRYFAMNISSKIR
jgi:hypothetical protein